MAQNKGKGDHRRGIGEIAGEPLHCYIPRDDTDDKPVPRGRVFQGTSRDEKRGRLGLSWRKQAVNYICTRCEAHTRRVPFRED